MKYKEINKRFSSVVKSYLRKGYWFNTATMGGSQGELCHVHLTNGKEIVCVLLERKGGLTNGGRVTLSVGKNKEVKPDSCNGWDTVWNSDLTNVQIIATYYEISRYKEPWYGTGKEQFEATKKRNERWKARSINDTKEMTDAMKQVALRWINKQPKCKSICTKDIERACYYVNNGKKIYYVRAKGREFFIRNRNKA